MMIPWITPGLSWWARQPLLWTRRRAPRQLLMSWLVMPLRGSRRATRWLRGCKQGTRRKCIGWHFWMYDLVEHLSAAWSHLTLFLISTVPRSIGLDALRDDAVRVGWQHSQSLFNSKPRIPVMSRDWKSSIVYAALARDQDSTTIELPTIEQEQGIVNPRTCGFGQFNRNTTYFRVLTGFNYRLY